MKYFMDPTQDIDKGWEKNILSTMKQHEINPSKIIMGGWYREVCMERVQKILRKSFPESHIIELRGHSSLSKTEHKRGFTDMREHHKLMRRRLKVRRAVLARKILR